MAGSKSTYLSKAILNHVLGYHTGPTGATMFTYTPPVTVYVGLWTQALVDASDGSNVNTPGEVARTGGTNYARASVANTRPNWPEASEPGDGTALKNNANPITFATAGASWSTITHFALLDTATAGSDPQSGNILYWGQLSAPKPIGTNDTASFAANALSITEN